MQTRIGKILIRSVQFLFWFLMLWAGFTVVLSSLVYAFSLLIGIYGDDFLAFAFSPLIWIYGDYRFSLATIVPFLPTCYCFWVWLRTDEEEWNRREYMREFKRGQRQAAWAKRSKPYRFLTSGGALLICLSLLALWYLFSQLI